MARGGTKSLSSLLPNDLLAQLRRQREESARLALLWERQVGEPLVKHVRPARYENRRLCLCADSPVWASRVRQQARELIWKLKRETYFSDLGEIQVRVKPAGVEGKVELPGTALPPGKSRPAAAGLPEAAAKLLRSLAEDMTDAKLGEALRRLGAAPRKKSPARTNDQ